MPSCPGAYASLLDVTAPPPPPPPPPPEPPGSPQQNQQMMSQHHEDVLESFFFSETLKARPFCGAFYHLSDPSLFFRV